MSSLTLPVGSPNNPSTAIAESLSSTELQSERSIISSVLSTVKEHKVSILLSILAITTGSAAVILYYTSKSSSLSSKPSHHSPPSTFTQPHPLGPTIADLQRRASHALHNGDHSAALTLLCRPSP